MESLLLSLFVSVVTVLSIGLAAMAMLTGFALIATLGCLVKLRYLKKRTTNESTRKSSRVAGYNAQFVRLTEDIQDSVIARTEHGL